MDMTARFKAYRDLNREIDLQIERLEQMEAKADCIGNLVLICATVLDSVPNFSVRYSLHSTCLLSWI